MKENKTNKAVLKEELQSWDLSVAYFDGLDDPKIEATVELIKYYIKKMVRYKGKINDMEPYEFEIFVGMYETVIKNLHKLYQFAHLNSDTQKTNQKATAFASKLDAELIKELDKIHFLYYEIASLDDDVKTMFLNSPKLREYIPWMQRAFASSMPPEAAYIYDALDFIQEKKSATDDKWGDLYSKTCSAMVFKLGSKTYTEAEIRAIWMTTHDPKLYEAADKELQRVYKQHADTFTDIFNNILLSKDVDAKLNGYYNAEEESCIGNVIPREHLLELTCAVCDSFYPLSRRFYELKRKLSESDKCHPLCHPLYSSPFMVKEKKYTWEECKKIVIDAYSAFSESYAEIGKGIIDAGTIDVGPKPGKKSGAYCTQGEIPYIFLNFTGTERDLSTFAHELGHGVNHALIATQGILNDRTPISLAEVASEFAEFLLYGTRFKQAQEADDKMTQLTLTFERLSDMISTIHRQIALYNFEKRAHIERQDGELSTERLGQIWAEEFERYTGIKLEGDKRNEWMYVSHLFEMPFYVYCYAFAGFIVNNLTKVYFDNDLEHEEVFPFPDRFVQFLSNTGLEFYPELLSPFEIDVNDPDFWKEGLTPMYKYLEFVEVYSKELGLL